MATINILRGSTIIKAIELNELVVFSNSIMDKHNVVLGPYTSPLPFGIQINDYIIFNGIKYTINTVPDGDVDHTYVFNYIFEAP